MPLNVIKQWQSPTILKAEISQHKHFINNPMLIVIKPTQFF